MEIKSKFFSEQLHVYIYKVLVAIMFQIQNAVMPTSYDTNFTCN